MTPEWAHSQPITLSTQLLEEGVEKWLLFYFRYDVTEGRTAGWELGWSEWTLLEAMFCVDLVLRSEFILLCVSRTLGT